MKNNKENISVACKKSGALLKHQTYESWIWKKEKRYKPMA
jgi:hypothetical protein